MLRKACCLAIVCQAFITSEVVSGETDAETNAGRFSGSVQVSDSLLNHAWTASRDAWNGFDTPYYDSVLRGPHASFWPDPTPGIRAQYYVMPDEWYTKSALGVVFQPTYSESEVPTLIPGSVMAGSLHWPVILETYYLNTDDRRYVKTLVRDAMPQWIKMLDGRSRNARNWPEELKTGVDYEGFQGKRNAITETFYYRALKSCERLYDEFGVHDAALVTRIESVEREFLDAFWDDEAKLFWDHETRNEPPTHHSVVTNALALLVGLMPDEGIEPTIQLIRKWGLDCGPLFIPYVIEACFVAGETQLGVDLLTFLESFEENPTPIYLIPEYVFGLKPARSAWNTIDVSPRFPGAITSARIQVPVPDGRVTMRYATELGVTVTVPVGSRVMADTIEGQNMVIKKYQSHTEASSLSDEAKSILADADWSGRVGDDAAIWISIDEQMLRIVQGDTITYQARCASATNGVGSMMDSEKTPLGWHAVKTKIGADSPWGQVFRSRTATREIWLPGKDTTEDLVLSRVMLLDGLEKGLNRGGNVDSMARYIYIHGTNDEARIGVPSSHGCIRLTNDDVIEVFELIPKGMKVLITASDVESTSD
ncbi:MAG: L,D-transpeptidase family protein [Candidatus Hydrogenedentota bacterium]